MTRFINKGQIQVSIGAIGILLTGIGFVVTPVATYFYGQTATAKEISELSTRTAVLENSIRNTDTNVTEIRDDLKDIKKALNIK